MLASALGVGVLLAGSAVLAQNWVPSTSPYGTWRQAAPAGKPVPNSWKQTPATVPTTAPVSKDASTTAPVPPLPPSSTPESSPAAQQAAPAVIQPVDALPPLPPPDQQAAPAAPKQTEQVLVLPDQQAAPAVVKPAEPLPPLPPPEQQPAPAVTKQAEPMPPAPTQETAPPAPLPPPAPVSAKDPAIIPVHNEIAEEAEQAQPKEAQQQYTIKRADFQPPIGLVEERRPSEDRILEQTVQLEPPGSERLFRLESEAALNERMRQEGKTRIPADKITFPEYQPVSRETYPGRHWPPQTEIAEPNYVCHRRLLFEDPNSERFGWDFGILQPVVSTAKFYADVVTLPYHLGTAPCRCYECSAGLCLPGDPVPYLCYPPELSATGALAEVGAIGAVLAIFP